VAPSIWSHIVPIETYIVSAIIVLVFGGFLALLVWAEWYTRVR
jgi:hypothetical protein